MQRGRAGNSEILIALEKFVIPAEGRNLLFACATSTACAAHDRASLPNHPNPRPHPFRAPPHSHPEPSIILAKLGTLRKQKPHRPLAEFRHSLSEPASQGRSLRQDHRGAAKMRQLRSKLTMILNRRSLPAISLAKQ